MSRHEPLSRWTTELSSWMPHLSKPQVAVLAAWSYGVAVTRTCSYHTIALFLALLENRKVGAVRQRLREWCYNAEDKRGKNRRQLDVETCFAPLLRWVVQLWASTRMALALDATPLGDRLTVLTVSVLYRGTGIPVAWTVLPARQRGSWREHWLRMLDKLQPAIPSDWTVLVLTDRGLYARWLFRHIVRLGWHPFMRINQGAKFRPAGQGRWYWLVDLLGQRDGCWRGAGTAFSGKDNHLECTLVAWWGEGHEEAWFILTDLPPAGCDAAWYGLRAWCEQGFKCLKRGGWQWQQTRMTEPARVDRLWLVLATATLWMVSVGSSVEDAAISEGCEVPDVGAILEGTVKSPRRRRVRILRLGWVWVLVRLIAHHPLPLPQRLVPEPWPSLSQGGSLLFPIPLLQKTYP